jgi:hypothetical protein
MGSSSNLFLPLLATNLCFWPLEGGSRSQSLWGSIFQVMNQTFFFFFFS